MEKVLGGKVRREAVEAPADAPVDVPAEDVAH